MKILVVMAIVFVVNLMPAFGPPTWLLLVYAKLRWNLNPVALVVFGGLAAAAGRYVLALGSRRLGTRLPARLRTNLEAAQSAVQRRRGGVIATVGLFVISPLPSAQLFVAAGLLDLNLVVLTVAFFAGRLVSYSLYITAATIAQKQLGDVLIQVWGSPWSIALQIGLVVIVGAIPFINWRRSDSSGSAST